MYLGNIIDGLNRSHQKIFFSGISFNSKEIKKNNIFFAIKGDKFDGNNYINDAIKKGSKIIISERKINIKNKKIIFLKTNNIRKLIAKIAFKDLKKRPKNLVAVTGTNGKSSVSDFYYQILNLNKKKVASIGTIGVKYKNKIKEISNTTLDAINLRKLFNNLGSKKVNQIILEASSHGLKQNRLDGLLFDIGIFTNLSHDHLDYHKNFRDYLDSKLYLFKYLLKKNSTIITDSTLPQFPKIKKIANKKKYNLLSVFEKNSDLPMVSHKYEDDLQIIDIKYKSQTYRIKLNLIGKIQIKNLLMALLATIQSNLDVKKVFSVISRIKSVEGRFEKIGLIKNNSKVILDYAHTPDALKTVLLNVKDQFPVSKISLVFGCGGDRDKEKRSKMGKIASKFSDVIYLTDDNPRSESPKKIRYDIKKLIKGKKIREIPSRKKAIFECINNLNSGDIAIIAGKGHEKTQDYKGSKKYFSDRDEILRSIKIKNRSLFKDFRLNIINEKTKNLPKNSFINKGCINSKEIKKNDIFFAIKGKKNDGNKFIHEAFKKKSSLAIVNKVNKDYSPSKQIKVKNSLKFLTECASIYRDNLKSIIISITGSCGKTTLKEMLGHTLNKISKVSLSPKSYNNKYGVPLSLFNLKQKDNFGVFEAGMDKKGEINFLTKILKPNIGIITNISYAHSKNFKNINGIADAKSEIINNIKNDGVLILNADDNFFEYHKIKALKRNLKVFSFGIKNKNSSIKLEKIQKYKKRFKLFIKMNNKLVFFFSNTNAKSYIQNLLATITSLHLFFEINLIPKDIFLNFNSPEGRGDFSKIKMKSKMVNLIDESYNSNPLSLKTALINFDNLNTNNKKKHVILGDMLELGKHSIRQHKLINKTINRTNIDKVHVIGKHIKKTYEGINKDKRGVILSGTKEIIDLINKKLGNNDYLMIKGSNSTGLYRATQNLKKKY